MNTVGKSQTSVNSRWYTVMVVNGREKKIKEMIQKNVEKYDTQINDILIPQERTVKIKEGKKVFEDKNLLPGYILIEFKKDNPDPDTIKEIERVKYVTGFLKDPASKRPLPLRKNELTRIIGVIDESKDVEKTLVKGEEVILLDGPFKTFNGVVEKVDNEKETVDVLVKIFGRDTNVTISVHQVERKS